MAQARYLLQGPYDIAIFDAPEVPTAVIKRDAFPMAEMATLFDDGLGALFAALGEKAVEPAGPVFSLHRRIPDETSDLEVGVPLGAPLEGPIDAGQGFVIEPSVLPAGSIAAFSHLGSYDALGSAWEGFLSAVSEKGARPDIPFWEVYVTEPYPGIDPDTLRTDLYTLLA